MKKNTLWKRKREGWFFYVVPALFFILGMKDMFEYVIANQAVPGWQWFVIGGGKMFLLLYAFMAIESLCFYVYNRMVDRHNREVKTLIALHKKDMDAMKELAFPEKEKEKEERA